MLSSALSAQAATAIVTATIGPAAPYYTDDVTATVTVSAASGPAPTGSIMGASDGGEQQTAALVNGVARLELSFFAPGAHSFVYSYGGDGNYAASASQTLSFTVADRPFGIIGSEYQYFGHSTTNRYFFTAALDSKNNVYLPDPTVNTLNKQDPQGNYTTVPTTGLSRPNGIVIDKSDNIYVADSGNARVVEINASGTQSVVPINGLIDPLSLALDPAQQNLYVTDQGNGSIVIYNIAAQTQTSISTNVVLYGIAVDASGNVYYTGATTAFSGDAKVYRRDPSGNTITVYTGLSGPEGLLADALGNLYIESGQGLFVLDTQSHLSQLTFETSLSIPVQGYILPGSLAMDRRGNIYRPSAYDIFVPGKSVNAGPAPYDPNYDYDFYVYYQVSYRQTITSITTVSGSPAVTLSNYVPTPAYSPASVPFIYFDEIFSLIGYAGPWSSYLTVTTSDGKQDTPVVYGSGEAYSFALAPGTITQQSLTVSGIGGIVADPTGIIYLSDPANNQVLELPPGATTTTAVPFSGLNKPTQLAVDGAGSVYVLDSGSSRILKIDAKGNQSVAFDLSAQTALTSLSTFTMDGATNLYLAGNAADGQSSIYYLDTLGNQLLVAGNLGQPTALAVDFNGYVFSVDTSGILTRFGPAGDATQIAIGFLQPVSVVVDASDTVYVASASGSGITMVSPDGTKTAYPTDALPGDDLTNASAIAVVPDGSGSLAVGDSGGKQVFRIVRAIAFGRQGIVNYAFGDVSIGSSRPIDGFVTNVGNVATPAFDATPAMNDFAWATDSQECDNDGSGGHSPLAPAAGCGMTLTFSPTYLGAHTDSLNFSVPSTSNIVLSINATGNGVAATGPQPVLTPAAMNFGNVPIGTVGANQTATLKNTGTTALTGFGFTLSGKNLGGFGLTGNNCGSSLAPGASCSIQINCEPVIVETLTASLNAYFPSPIPQQSIALTCNGTATAAPQAALTPATANFGSVTSGTTSAAQTFTLANAGNAALAITSVSLSGTNASSFKVSSNTCGSSLAANTSCNLAVTFSPPSTGSFSASLSVVDAVGTQTSTLAGTGTTVAAPQAALTPATANFGNLTTGTTSSAQTFTLTNAGNAALSITSIGIAGANANTFTIHANTCGTSLSAGASCAVSVTFAPTAVGPATANLSIADNATGSPQTSSLTGAGIAPAAPAATLTPAKLDFGSIESGTKSAVQAATLSNTGNAALTIASISLAGANGASFASTNNCSGTLTAGASCTISVTFDPAAAGTDTATLSVSDNAPGSPQTSLLTGVATAPPMPADFSIVATPASQSVTAGSSAVYQLKIASVGGSFTEPVALAASDGLPSGATVNFTPTSVTPGTAGSTSTMTIQTAAQQATAEGRPARWQVPVGLVSAALLLLPFRRRRPMSSWLGCMLLLVVAGALSACGGGFALPRTTPPSATYTVTVTGTSGSLQHSTSVQITVR